MVRQVEDEDEVEEQFFTLPSANTVEHYHLSSLQQSQICGIGVCQEKPRLKCYRIPESLLPVLKEEEPLSMCGRFPELPGDLGCLQVRGLVVVTPVQ